METLRKNDPEVYSAINKELFRQREKLELIASENFVSNDVLSALGSVLTNKYAEGYPGKRYYGGCEFVDIAENIARDRLKTLFGAEYANVQPHSGSQANMAAYFSFIKPGDKVLGMDLSHGGHLTHGSPVNFSGKLFNFVSYGVNKDTGRIDYNLVEDIAQKEKPKMIVAGASAYSRDYDFKTLSEISKKVGAFLMADIAHPAGIIAMKYLNDPLPYCDIVTSTTHKTLRGPRGGLIIIGKDSENPFGLKMGKSGRTKLMSEVVDGNVMPGIQGGPLMHVIAAKAVAFGECLKPEFKIYIQQVLANAKALAKKMASLNYQLISGGTDNHLMLIDLRNKDISGKEAEIALEAAGITVNKNMVPFDDKSPMITSGIRIGTPAITTRGMKESEMEIIAELIDKVIKNHKDVSSLEKIKNEVKDLCGRFPLYGGLD